jgi:hypothetical protein
MPPVIDAYWTRRPVRVTGSSDLPADEDDESEHD